jgi:hypothetical protein
MNKSHEVKINTVRECPFVVGDSITIRDLDGQIKTGKVIASNLVTWSIYLDDERGITTERGWITDRERYMRKDNGEISIQ